MEIKLFEVRDRGTCIPVCALRWAGQTESERWLLDHAGYGRDEKTQADYILVAPLVGQEKGQITYDAFHWSVGRTLHEAHLYLMDHFDEMQSGDVVDVEFILSETTTPKISERLR